MSRRPATLVLLLAIATVATGGDGEQPLAPGVRQGEAEGLNWIDAVLPGRLVSYALVAEEQVRRVYLLVAPEDYTAVPRPQDEEKDAPDRVKLLPPCPRGDATPPMHLYRLERQGEGSLVLLHDDLPGDCTALDAADVDGDGEDELLVARPGELMLVEADRRVTLVEDPGLAWVNLHPRRVHLPALEEQSLVFTVGLGRLNLYGPKDGEQRWALLADVDLPIRGRIRGTFFDIRNPALVFVGRNDAGTLFFAAEPEIMGQRLKLMRIEIAPSGEASVTECWARLPEPEEVLDWHYLLLDRRPVLLVTTRPANKLALFGEKRLRLYELERDRSRLGIAPRFATDSRLNLWQEEQPRIEDVNGDGLGDLVLVYWKGMKGDRIVLDVYLGATEGVFETSAGTTAFDIKKGDRSFVRYGRDVDGDSHPDLLVRSEEFELLYPGLPSSNGKKLVDKTPRKLPLDRLDDEPWTTVVSVGSQGASTRTVGPVDRRPVLADLEEDGQSELVFVRRGSATEPGLFRVVWVHPLDD